MKNIIILLIRIYQNIARLLNVRTCRFEPSCSFYMIDSINEKGLFRGIPQGLYRLLRCNPFNPGGYDPVNATK